MFELKFDERKCSACQTCDCLTKCQYMDLDIDTAKMEMRKIINGEDSFVLHDCVTCYACEEYCKMGNHPFYLIVERQEELDIPPIPYPLIKRGVQLGIPFRGEPQIVEVKEPVVSLGVFSNLAYLTQGKLFDLGNHLKASGEKAQEALSSGVSKSQLTIAIISVGEA